MRKIEHGVSSARDEALAGSLMAKYLPFRSKPLRPNDVKAVYVPLWFIDGEIAGNVTRSGAEVRGVEFCDKGMVSWFARCRR